MRLKREDYLYSRAQWTLEKESARYWWQNKAQVEICTEHRHLFYAYSNLAAIAKKL